MKLSTDKPPTASSTSHANATPVSLEETRRAYYTTEVAVAELTVQLQAALHSGCESTIEVALAENRPPK